MYIHPFTPLHALTGYDVDMGASDSTGKGLGLGVGSPLGERREHKYKGLLSELVRILPAPLAPPHTPSIFTVYLFIFSCSTYVHIPQPSLKLTCSVFYMLLCFL